MDKEDKKEVEKPTAAAKPEVKGSILGKRKPLGGLGGGLGGLGGSFKRKKI